MEWSRPKSLAAASILHVLRGKKEGKKRKKKKRIPISRKPKLPHAVVITHILYINIICSVYRRNRNKCVYSSNRKLASENKE